MPIIIPYNVAWGLDTNRLFKIQNFTITKALVAANSKFSSY